MIWPLFLLGKKRARRAGGKETTGESSDRWRRLECKLISLRLVSFSYIQRSASAPLIRALSLSKLHPLLSDFRISVRKYRRNARSFSKKVICLDWFCLRTTPPGNFHMNRPSLVCSMLVAMSFAMTGCASTAYDVPAKAVPMTAYKQYECHDLKSEHQRVSQKADALAAQIDQGLLAERLKMGVGVVLFWPALLLIDNQTQHHHQLASLKGERKTLSESLKARNCSSGSPAGPAQAGAQANTR